MDTFAQQKLAFLIISALIIFQPSYAASKFALVIGNANYEESALKNPINDSQDIAAKLTKLGFKVSLLQDASLRKMRQGVREFKKSLQTDSIGLFYYAGHGIQSSRGDNYLIPTKADIQAEVDLSYEALDAG